MTTIQKELTSPRVTSEEGGLGWLFATSPRAEAGPDVCPPEEELCNQKLHMY